MGNQEVQTVMTTKFTGNIEVVKAQAGAAKPINNEDIIARNTRKEVDFGGSEVKKPCTCNQSCCRGNQ